MALTRRECLGWMGAAGAGLAGCRAAPHDIPGGFTAPDPARGHRWRDAARAEPTAQRRTGVLVLGGGVAGLAAARSLALAGVDDFALLEFEDTAGGNARGGLLGGLACPLGAHYLPAPSDDAPELQAWLEQLGLRQRIAGRWVWDERHLCHSPQERLYWNGHWQDGLLPIEGASASTLQQYRRMSQLIGEARHSQRWAMPALRLPVTDTTRALWSQSFAQWLDGHGLDDPQLRWYLDYACRDDYGASARAVSAWAGIHYFASRHGFPAPGEAGEAEPLLTWPEGNAWLTQQLAAGLGERLHTGQGVLRVTPGRHGVTVDALSMADGRVTRWQAGAVVVALPVFIAKRLIDPLPPLLAARANGLSMAPWVVVNLLLDGPPKDRGGAHPSWDNVVYGSAGLGYVDASHQSLARVTGPRVWTWYRPLGDESAGRQNLLQQPWTHWSDQALAELSVPHPDLPGHVTEVSVTRYGHAMAIPAPGSLYEGPTQDGRLCFAHADWAGYSVFEEAFTRGHLAGQQAAQRLRA
ncbi:FAD-dependent oxidoreductase [Hydrogenophaga sp. MI9]|uniref:FAD-dependent oxidoreductase n=1 Tax=Hydrogenophaga sp. MI9 TaxID=3453719 RepID=UPI003EED1044